jgi:outer membrane protein, heavy metal efflux system
MTGANRPLGRAVVAALLLVGGHGGLMAMDAQAVDFGAVLPPEPVAQAAIDSSPLVVAAREEIPLGEARNRRLRAGQYEWQIDAFNQARTDAAGRQYREQQYELQRRIRLPGKAAMDRRLGEFAVAAGESRFGESRHVASRLLLDEWMAYLRAGLAERRLGAAVALLGEQLGGVEQRVATGDAARIDAELARADLDLGRMQHLEAQRAVETARLALRRDFPALDLPLPQDLPDPVLPEGGEAQWVARILAHDHGLELAGTQAEMAELSVQRSRRERLADPTLGMQYSPNFDQNREVVGVRIIVPIGGSGRAADVAAARSNAAIALAEREQAERLSDFEARSEYLAAHSTYAQWQRIAAVARTSAATAATLFEGYRLGEYDFATVLAARRQAAEVAEQADGARLAAWHAHARLKIDAHEVWAAPEATEHPEARP